MPLGLSSSDFDALEVRPVRILQWAEPQGIDVDMEDSIATEESDQVLETDGTPALESESADWTTDDDRMLVTTALKTLRPSGPEWEEFGHQLGRDRDSLDRRWITLVSDGRVGFCSERTEERTRLGIKSW